MTNWHLVRNLMIQLHNMQESDINNRATMVESRFTDCSPKELRRLIQMLSDWGFVRQDGDGIILTAHGLDFVALSQNTKAFDMAVAKAEKIGAAKEVVVRVLTAIALARAGFKYAEYAKAQRSLLATLREIENASRKGAESLMCDADYKEVLG